MDLPNGLFWTVKVPDSAVQITDNTLTIHLVDVPTVDAFSFPPPPQDVPGISPFHLIPAKVSFDIVYRKTGHPRQIRPASDDPLSPLNWAGTMWDATNSGTFSLTYDDGTFSASGSFDSSLASTYANTNKSTGHKRDRATTREVSASQGSSPREGHALIRLALLALVYFEASFLENCRIDRWCRRDVWERGRAAC